MYVCFLIYACIYVLMCVRMHARMCVCVCAYVCVYVCMYVCMYVSIDFHRTSYNKSYVHLRALDASPMAHVTHCSRDSLLT